MLRELAYIFTYRADLKISLITKLYIPIALMLFLLLAINSKNILLTATQLITILILELSILMYIGSLKRIVSAIIFITIFISIGLVIRTLSIALSYEPTALEDMILSTLRVIEFFLAITIALQWIKVSEYRWIFKKLGLSNIATLLTLVLTQFSPILIAYSEALTTIRLKYGGKALQKVVKPLIIYSLNYGRDIAEAIYMYGISEPDIEVAIEKVDVMLIVVITIALIQLCIIPNYVIQ